MVFDTIGSSEVAMAGRTYSEINEIAEQDGSVLVVPTGSVEQHGHHMPVATDTILADAVALSGAQTVADALPVLVTPPVWTGYSPHHLSFGGTITLDVEELHDVLVDIAESAVQNGFDAILFLNGHGGNSSIIGSATGTIGHEHPEIQALSLSYYTLADSFIDEIRDSDTGGTSHAGEFETSLMLHLRPELVDQDAASPNYRDEPYDLARQDMFQGGPLGLYRDFTELTDEGPIGDPTLASAEKGAEIFARLGDEIEDLLREIHEQNRDRKEGPRG